MENEASTRVWQLIERHVPLVDLLRTYPRDWLRPDLVSGLASWGVMVPVALAYAQMAGVPAKYGLVTATVALAAYSVFGTSRQLRVTTSSTMAVMSAAVVAPLAGGDAAQYLALTSAFALVVGAILVALGVVKLGFIADFMAKSVVTGFVFGLAITIAVGQLPKLFGVPKSSGNVFQQIVGLIEQLGDANVYAFALGASAIVVIALLKLLIPRVPASLVALVLGIAATTAFDLTEKGVTVVGTIGTGFPLPALPGVSLGDLPYLATGAVGVVFLAVGESLGAARSFAARHRYEIDPDQELIALGAANLGTGLFQGFVVDASLSQSATADQAGSMSQVSSLVTATFVFLTAVFLAPLFKNLPDAVLAAVVIMAVISLMDVAELRRYWATRRTDFVIAMVALVGVVTTDVLTGLIIAVFLSLIMLLYRASRAHVAVLGRVPGQVGAWGDVERHPENQVVPGLLVLRLDAPMYFFNADTVRGRVRELARDAGPAARAVAVDVGASADLDVTSLDALEQLVTDLRDVGLEVYLVQTKGALRDRLRRAGLMDLIGEEHVLQSVAAAVDRFERES